MKQTNIYWLEQIFRALKEISSVQKNQADWEEADETAASYIKNKPTIPQADWEEADETADSYIKNKPTIPSAPIIVEGTESSGAFTPASGAPSFAEAKAAILAGNMVLLQYTDTDEAVISEMVLAFDDEAIITKNLTWEAE